MLESLWKKAPQYFNYQSQSIDGSRLDWLLLGRLVFLFLFLGIIVANQIVRATVTPIDSVIQSLCLVSIFFGINFLESLSLNWLPNRWELGFAHLLLDMLGVSIWFYLNYSPAHPIVLLYLILVLAASLAFYQRGAFLAFLSASACFFIVSNVASAGSSFSWLSWSVYSGIFLLVGAVGGYLSEQLRKTAEGLRQKNQEIEKLTELYEQIVEGMPTGLLTLDQEKRVGFVNPGAEQILGKNRANLLGRPLHEVVADLMPFFDQIESQKIEDESDDAEQSGIETELTATGTDWHRSVFLKARLHKRQARLQQTVEIGTGKNRRLLRGDVAEIDVSPSVENLFGQSEGKARVLLFQDVTKLVHLEDKLKQHEKLAAVGQLAAGIAHEIRNPLASMSASIEMLQTGPAQSHLGTEDKRLMEIVGKEIDRLNKLITEFLGFVKPEQMKLETVLLDKLLAEVVDQASQTKEFISKARIEMKFEPGLPAYGNHEKIRQIVWNLLNNALQAMKKPGLVEVGCETVSPHWVCFWVQDEGEGMSDEVLQHLYEPFFTTKDKGTGLGLATVYKIVEGHQGEIRVQSKVGQGTRFEIHLHRG